MLTIIAFLITIGVLVTVHEFGHYQVAKWCGVKVLKFSIGFGQPLWSKTLGKDRTQFIIAAIPFGGYVKFLDERELNESADQVKPTYPESDLKRAFNRQPVLKRMAVVLAGPFANLLLAVALYWMLLMMGVMGIKPTLGIVPAHSYASAAGFVSKETIQSINGFSVDTWQEVNFLLLKESLKSDSVEIQTFSKMHGAFKRQLNVSTLSFDQPNQDVMATLGFTYQYTNLQAKIGEVKKSGIAATAGFKRNDIIISVNKEKIHGWQNFSTIIKQNPNVQLKVSVKRGDQVLLLTVKPEPVKLGNKTEGMIGVAVLDTRLSKINYPVWRALTKACQSTWDTSILSLKLMGKLITGQLSIKNMSGPVTIANAAGDSAERGWKQFVGFLAFISISIGVMNLLPIPVLDGGHFMYYMAELLTGKPVPESVMVIGQKIGFLLLGLMMLVAFYNDLSRLATN